MKFDYRDNILPRSIVSFFFSNNGNDWKQIGSNHTSGVVIDLIDNNSFFEVGGWADGQSPGGSYLDGFVIKDLTIETDNYTYSYNFTKVIGTKIILYFYQHQQIFTITEMMEKLYTRTTV